MSGIIRITFCRITIIEKDLRVIDQIGIDVKLNSLVEEIKPNEESKFEVLGETFDAVFVGTGFASDESFGIECKFNAIIIEPVTFETNSPGIFSGGGAIIPDPNRGGQTSISPIISISDGHRAATSIDRYFQRVSMSASRIREGAYETRLFTSIKDILPKDVIKAKNQGVGYSFEEAKQEASRCLKCDCMECVKVCEYLKEYGSYPKRYVREIYNNLSIVKGERRKNQFINSCSLCGLCAEVCPTDLDMGTVCLESRREMVTTNRMPPSAHDFALRDMQFSNSNKFSLVRNQPGTTNNKYLFSPAAS